MKRALRPFIPLLLTLAAGTSVFAQTSFDQLVQKETRPTVADVEALLREQPAPQPPDGSHFPKDEKRPEPQLQNNFGVWTNEIKKRAAHMIVSFEKNLPGVNFVFVGRDMAIIADLFEAFYRSIGQPDRVIRIGMSSGTVPSLSNADGVAQTTRFLESSGLKIEANPKHPFIFVDAISRGGGRQVRFLLKNIYAKLVGEEHAPLGKTLLNYNAVGLAVYTTGDNFVNLGTADSFFDHLDRSAEKSENAQNLMDAQFNLMVYRDGRAQKSFVGINEAGYTHWTGAWHESYGETREENGQLKATPGVVASPEVRDALLKFQMGIVEFAESTELRDQILAEARNQGYEFPLKRPASVLNVSGEVKRRLEKATSFEERLAIYHEYAKVAIGKTKQQALGQALMQSVIADPQRKLAQIIEVARLTPIAQDLAVSLTYEELAKATTWDEFNKGLAQADTLFREHNLDARASNAAIFTLATRLPYDEHTWSHLVAISRRGAVNALEFQSAIARQIPLATSLEALKALQAEGDRVARENNVKLNIADDLAKIALARFPGEEARAFALSLPIRNSGVFDSLAAATPGDQRLAFVVSLLAERRIDSAGFTRIVTGNWVAVETSLIGMSQKNQQPAEHKTYQQTIRYLLDQLVSPKEELSVFRRAIVSSLTADEFIGWFAKPLNSAARDASLQASVQTLLAEQLPRFFALKPKPAQVNALMKAAPELTKRILIMGIQNASSLEEANAFENRGTVFTQTEEVKAAMKELKERTSGGNNKSWMFWKSASIRCEAVF